MVKGGIKVCKSSEENCDLNLQGLFSKTVTREIRKNGKTKGRPQNSHMGSGRWQVKKKKVQAKEKTESQGYKWNLHKAARGQLTVHKIISLLEHNSCLFGNSKHLCLSLSFNRCTTDAPSTDAPLFSEIPILKIHFVSFELKSWHQKPCLQRVCI